ncbi:LutC/YkgG family protein [Haliea sp. E17]|uniref:LutC/YkgG family protein n=1 Tax=Haliea sp. E17 TaxID=3401576 RepID=UPI003AAA926C
MSSENRKRILARVRGAARGMGADAVARELAGLGRSPAAHQLDADSVVNFMTNVLRNHGTLALAEDRREAVKGIGQYLYKHFRAHRLVAGNEPHLAAMPWREGGVLPRFGELEPGEKAALSYADWGIAETGATVLLSGKHNPPANHLLPEHHIVLVERARILPDMESFWSRQDWHRGQRPRGIYCIAGPSSTGDIEARLVYGAHGPQAWHVIVIGKTPPQLLETALELARAAEAPGDRPRD